MKINPNKSYLLFLVIVIPLYIVFFTSPDWLKTKSVSESENYNVTLQLSEYYVKAAYAMYNTDTKDLTVNIYCKAPEQSAAGYPEIYSVSVTETPDSPEDEPLTYAYTDLPAGNGKKLTIHQVRSDFPMIKIWLQSSRPDIVHEQTVDEFGNIIPAYSEPQEPENLRILIDAQDVQFLSNEEAMTVTELQRTIIFDTDAESSQASSISSPSVTTRPETTTSAPPATGQEQTGSTSGSSAGTVSANSAASMPVTTSADTTSTTPPTTTVKPASTDTPAATTKPKTTTTARTSVKTQTKTTTTAKTTTTTKKTTTETMPPISVNGIKLATTALDNNVKLAIGDTSVITPVISPSSATNKTVMWSSNKPAVACVDSSGKVLARSPGKAIITATTEDGGLTASCMITVTE
ncbi:MAG: Ig-like domain-containing protein [Oscillospiraceae bacterium]